MNRTRLCKVCGTPLLVSRELRWESNGVICLTRSPRNRMVLYESNILDNLFQGIEDLIGVKIEHIVIESRRREVRRYIEGSFPAWIRKPLIFLNRALGDKPVIRVPVRWIRNPVGKSMTRKVFDVGKVYGYGDCRLGPLWKKGDTHPWRVTTIRKPYSVPFFAAESLASVEAFEGRDHWVDYRKIDEDTYEMESYPSAHIIELKERLQRKRYRFKPGDIHYERCPGCGVPMEVARLRWDLDEGTITDDDTGRRMALFGPYAVDAVLQDLEAELGGNIPDTVIEAQRRYIKSRVAGDDWRRSAHTFGYLTALRGLGYITEFEVEGRSLSVVVHNSCMPLLVMGMAKAIYEIAMGEESSTCNWRLGDDGDLSLTIEV